MECPEKVGNETDDKVAEKAVGIRAATDFLLSTGDLADLLNTNSKQIFTEFEALLSHSAGQSAPRNFIPPSIVRKILANRGFRYPQKTISFQMLKGGVAKTSSALNFGLRAAQYGARVLFVDLDQQANLSFALGVADENLPVWVDLVEKKANIEEVTRAISENVDLIPSSLNNSVLDRVLMNSQRNWSQSVLNPLKAIRSYYDFIIIDTAPHLSMINSAVTVASDEIILPINPDRFSILGLQKHREDLADLRAEFNLSFNEKILLTRFDAREKVSHEIKSHCEKMYRKELLSSVIRTSSEVKNSLHRGRSLFAQKSVVKEDYDRMTREILGLWEPLFLKGLHFSQTKN